MAMRAGFMALTATVLLAATTAHAAPAVGRACPGVVKSKWKGDPVLGAVVARQLKAPKATVVETLSMSGWTIVAGEVSGGDRGWVFFREAPSVAPAAYIWGGSAQPADYADVRQRVLGGARGIPPALAACFAHIVTGG